MLINYKNVNVYQHSGEKILEGVNLELRMSHLYSIPFSSLKLFILLTICFPS